MRDEELIADQPRPPAGCATQGCGCLLVICVVIPGALMLLGMFIGLFQ
jgi:hypothetical protein